MKKVLFIATLCLSIIWTTQAQTPTPTINGTPPPFIFTGSVTQTGQTFNFTGGSGTFNALTGDASSTSTGGATTVLGINNTLLSSLATGILKNTTTTGIPSIAVAGTDYQQALSLLKGTYTDTDWCSYAASGTLLNCNNSAPQPALSLLKGTYTDGDLCTYAASGTLLNCNTSPSAATTVATTTKSDNTSYYLGLWPANSSSNQAAVVVNATYNPSTGTLTFPAGSSLGTSDTGTPRLTFATNLASTNVNFSAPALLSGTPSSGAQAAIPSGAHGVAGDETSTAGVPASAVDYLRFDATNHCIEVSTNNAAESCAATGTNTLTLTNKSIAGSEINSGTIAATYLPTATNAALGVAEAGSGLGVSSGVFSVTNFVADVTFTVSSSTTINANSCSPASSSGGTSVTMTGLTSTMALSVTPNADITNTTGWGNPAAGVLYITLAPGSGAFTYHVCNNTASNITTGGSATFNVAAR